MKKGLIVVLSVSIVLMGFSVFSVAEKELELVGDWAVRTGEDPLTDELHVELLSFTDKGIATLPALGISLKEGQKFRLVVMWRSIKLANNKIMYRLDDGEVEESEWYLSTNNTALAFPAEEKDLESFVRRLIKAEEFIVGVYPRGRARRTDVFGLKGLGESLLPYLEEFGWEDLEETIQEELEETGT